MKRHIKVKATINPPKIDEVIVQVVSQTHRADDFSEPGKSDAHHHTGCFRHRKVVLVGLANHPSKFHSKQANGDLLIIVNGPEPFSLPIEHWPAVKAAFLAYNEWGATT